jgi:glycosyltransferase involved in cell wall biosynthesis
MNPPDTPTAEASGSHKGAQHLVAAMHSVWETSPDAQLVFVGRDARWKRGWMSDHLRELAGSNVDRVHVRGAQPTERDFAAVAASDVIAIPSLWESFCLAAVEAMVLGRPVIGTRDNGFSEFIRDDENGLLVGRGSVPELAAAVSRLLESDQLRAELGAAAARTAELHDAPRVAPRYADTLARVADG